jgi:hypothetical protein
VVLRHPRHPGARLHGPPPGTEDQTGKGTALVPGKVPARGKGLLKVEERQAISMAVDWFSNEADAAVKVYVGDARADAKLAAVLKSAWAVRDRIVKATQDAQKLRSEKAILERAAHETRENLRAISRSKTGVAELRQRLTGRLEELDEKLAELNKRLVEVELTMNEQRVRFDELVRDLVLREPLPVA